MPKKAKKGGGGRGGGRTEEERLLLLQQRAQAEEETAKKKEEILTLFLRDKLQKEERNTAVNQLKLADSWRFLLRVSRGGELRRDVAALSQTFERQRDVLDSVIKSLARQLQEAERQSAQVRRVHLQDQERLRELQDEGLGFLQQRWDAGLQQLRSRFSSETRRISSDSRQQRDVLRDAAFTAEQQQQAELAEVHRLYGERVTAHRAAHGERAAAEPEGFTDTTESLDTEVKKQPQQKKQQQEKQQMQDAAQRCREETQQLQLHLNQQVRQVMVAAEDGARTLRRLQRLQDGVRTVRGRLASTRTEGASLEKDLTAARDRMSRRTRALQDQQLQVQAAARRQLTELTVQSAAAARTLQDAAAKGQQVLRVAHMCRRLEGEWRAASVFPSEERGAEEAPGAEETSALQQVLRSINASELLGAALRRRSAELRRENQQLQLLLRQHQDAMTLSGADLHALLAVSGAPTIAVPPDPDRRHAVIEAVHAVKHV